MVDADGGGKYECDSCEVKFTLDELGKVEGVEGVRVACPICGRGRTVKRRAADAA